MLNWVKKIFQLDERTIGVFRLSLGLMLVLDALSKLAQSKSFYTDWGIAPRSYYIDNFMNLEKFSFHLASGELWFQVLLIGIQLFAALMYFFGIHPRRFGALCFLMIFSLQARNAQILSAADEILRLGLLWSLFLPLQVRFAWRGGRGSGEQHFSIGALLLQSQLLFMYFFSVFHKYHPVWVEEYSAVYYALHGDMFAKPFGMWLRQFEDLLKFATVSSFLLEGVGSLLFLVGGWVRFFVALSFISFHFSLFLAIDIGLFPWICIAYWTIGIPKQLWETSFGTKLERFLDSKLRTDSSGASSEEPKPIALIMPKLGLGMFALLVWINISSLPQLKDILAAPPSIVTALTATHQQWDMFAPPYRNDGWFVIKGKFTDGVEKNLWNEDPISYGKPEVPSRYYPTSEWRKYMYNVWDRGNRKILLPFARYLCRLNKGPTPEESVQSLTIEFVKERTPDPGQPFEPPEIVKLWSHDCFA